MFPEVEDPWTLQSEKNDQCTMTTMMINMRLAEGVLVSGGVTCVYLGAA